jgi:serine/threonine protein kinase
VDQSNITGPVLLDEERKLGRYEIRSKLGEGGMGEVYLVQDTSESDRTVVVKILPLKSPPIRKRM